MLLRRVVRREQSRPLLLGQSFAGVGHFDVNGAIDAARADGERPAGRHGVDGVQQEVLHRAAQLLGVGANRLQRRVEIHRQRNRRAVRRLDLRAEQLRALTDDVVRRDARELRPRHAREVAEAADHGVEIRQPARHRRQAFVEHFVELRARQRLGPAEIVERDAQRKERVLELVRQPPGELAPGGDALGLNQPLALIDQLPRHRIEGARQLLDLAGRVNVADPDVPVAARDAAARLGQLLDRTGHARGHDVAQNEADRETERAEHGAAPADARHERRELAARAADEEHTEHGAVAAGERNRVDPLGTVGPLDRFRRLAAALPHARDQRLELRRLRDLPRRIDQLLPRDFPLHVPVEQRARAGGQDERLQKRLVEPPAAGDEHTAVTCGGLADRHQSERGLVRQFDRLEKRAASGARCGRPRMAIAEPGRPLRRRDDRSVLGDEIEHVPALRGGDRRGLVDVGTAVGARPRDVSGGAEHGVTRRQTFDARGNLVRFARELAAELREQRGGALRVDRREGIARACRHRDRDQHHRDGHRRADQRKDACAASSSIARIGSLGLVDDQLAAQPRWRGSTRRSARRSGRSTIPPGRRGRRRSAGGRRAR